MDKVGVRWGWFSKKTVRWGDWPPHAPHYGKPWSVPIV